MVVYFKQDANNKHNFKYMLENIIHTVFCSFSIIKFVTDDLLSNKDDQGKLSLLDLVIKSVTCRFSFCFEWFFLVLFLISQTQNVSAVLLVTSMPNVFNALIVQCANQPTVHSKQSLYWLNINYYPLLNYSRKMYIQRLNEQQIIIKQYIYPQHAINPTITTPNNQLIQLNILSTSLIWT